jgi:pimeloyl-ACP methyl ester carboxylesterase
VAPDRPVTLVFWPGLNPAWASQLDPIAPFLTEAGVRVITIAPPWDRPTPDDYLPSRLAAYVLDVVPVDRFVFMGFSWGGSIGVQLAADHPERLDGLILLDAGYRDLDLGGVPLDVLVEHFRKEHEESAAWSPRAAGWALRGVATEKQTATHGRLRLPILLVLARDAEGTVPNAEVHRLDAGHDVIRDQPSETARLVVDWLARLPADG